jgi:hypothetical protein
VSIGCIRVTGIVTHLLAQMGNLRWIAIEFGSNARELEAMRLAPVRAFSEWSTSR